MLRLPLLYATQRTRYVRRKIYIYGLCKGGVAFTNRDGNRYGIYITFIIPILSLNTQNINSSLVAYIFLWSQFRRECAALPCFFARPYSLFAQDSAKSSTAAL